MWFKKLKIALICLLTISMSVKAAWQVCEETNVKGTISGTIKKGSLIKMQSGSIYEVTGVTIQLVLQLAPDALVLKDGLQFRITIDGFEEPLDCKQLVPPLRRQSNGLTTGVSNAISASSVVKEISLESFIAPEQQRMVGIQKLTKDEREELRRRLAGAYLQGMEHGRKMATVLPPKLAATGVSTVESHIEGEFEGWEGETVVKLDNGQIWEQTEYHYHYHYAYRPKVLIYLSGAVYKMKVDGIEKAVGVTRIK